MPSKMSYWQMTVFSEAVVRGIGSGAYMQFPVKCFSSIFFLWDGLRKATFLPGRAQHAWDCTELGCDH